MRHWDFVAAVHAFCLSVFCFWSCRLFWQNPNTVPEEHKPCSWLWRGNNIVGRHRCCGCSAAHVPRSLHGTCHEAFADTHTHLCLLDGWPGTGCPTICTDRITLTACIIEQVGSVLISSMYLDSPGSLLSACTCAHSTRNKADKDAALFTNR